MSPFDLPTNCIACGAPLRGSLTRHTNECPIRQDLADQYPDFPLPPPPDPDPEDVPAADEEPDWP